MLTRFAVLCAAGVLLVACSTSGSTGAQLRTTAVKSGGAGLAVAKIRAGSPVTFMDGDLCTTGKPVTITSVEALSSNGHVTLEGWGVRPDVGGYSEYRQSARSIGARHTPVDTKCGGQVTTELDVQLSATSPKASVQAFRVNYDGGHVITWLAVAMCTPVVTQDDCGKFLHTN